MDNFILQIIDRLKSKPNEDAIVEVNENELVRYSKGDLLARTENFLAFLNKQNLEPGARIAIIASNCFDWVACDLAILISGHLSVPLYSRQSPNEWQHALKDCGAKIVFVGNTTIKKQLLGLYSEIRCFEFSEVSRHGSKPIAVTPGRNPVCTLVYTSGTSGAPKGAMITITNLNYMLDTVIDHLESTLDKNIKYERVFHYLPVCFMGSRIMLLAQLKRGTPIFFSGNIEKLKDELKLVNPHYFLNVPALLERLKTGVETHLKVHKPFFKKQMDAAFDVYNGTSTQIKDRISFVFCQKVVFPKIRKQIGSHLKFLICGSAPLLPETQAWFEMLGIKVLQVYGLTETTAIITMDTFKSAAAGEVGKPILGVELALNAEGELLVKGDNIFSGYWNLPSETAKSFDHGWFKTGDRAEITHKGTLKILGRMKNVLVLESGHNVVPETIEDKILVKLPGLSHAVVLGHGKPFLTAVLSGSCTLNQAQTAIDELNAELPHYQRIKRFFITSQPFSHENGTLTANLKLRRSEIQSIYVDQISKLYEGAGKSI